MLVRSPAIRKAGKSTYKRRTLSVSYVNLNVDSPFISRVTDGDLEAGDIILYKPMSGAGKRVEVDSDGLVTIKDQTADDTFTFWVEDSSNAYAKVGPATVTLDAP